MAVIGVEYTNDIADVTAAYPDAVTGTTNFRDDRSTYAVTGEVTAPALRDGYSRWRLPMSISEGSLAITLAAVAQELVPYGQVPVAGQVGVSYSGALLDFPAANVGEEFAVSYTGIGTRVTGEFLNKLQLEVVAVQTKAEELEIGAGFVLPIGGEDGQALTSDGDNGAEWTTIGGAALLDVGTTTGTVAAGDDGRFHDAVTLAGTPDYLTISGQEVTLAEVDLAADVTGALPVANGGTGQTSASAALTALGGAPLSTTIQEKTDAYTLQASDNGTIIIFSGLSGAVDFTIPASLSGFVSCVVINADDTDAVTIVASAVTMLALDGLVLEAGGAGTSIIHRGSNSYVAVGRHST